MPHLFDVTSTLEPLPSPRELVESLPASASHHVFVRQARQAIVDILSGKSSRILLVVGPCSIHDTGAAKDFAKKLHALSERVSDRFLLVMRAYFEKPRTGLGWKGLLYDPAMDGSNNLLQGLMCSRQLLRDLAEMGVPAATEFLDPSTPLYLGDLISWGSVGSRTTESQPHRQMISSLHTPTGFKNATNGCLEIAVNALLVAQTPHTFIGLSPEGRVSVVRSRGNPHCHMILRGGITPNYDPLSVRGAIDLLQRKGLNAKVVIDCSHDNSGKDPMQQPVVFRSAIEQILAGNQSIVGMIVESHHKGGRQALGVNQAKICGQQSVTDACLSWNATEEMILQAYYALRNMTAAS